jgi:uncharacterized oxidoreductase
MKLTGKYAVVTGGASGIGLALSRTLQAHGAQVLAIGRDAAKLDAARELGIGVLSADVADGAERQRVIDTLLDAPTPIDIFINNAGTMQRFKLLDTDAMARTEDELDLDLHAPLHFCTALLDHLISRPEAAIVNITSGLVYAPYSGAPAYSAAKGGLQAFTKSLRWQTRHTGLKVVEVLPPAVDTDMTEGFEGLKIKPTTVANATVKALKRDRSEARVGPAKALYALSRLAPNAAFTMINRELDKATAT